VVVNFLVHSDSNLSQLAVALTYAIAASGLGFALGLGGEYILAQGSIFACSAYVTAIMVANHGWNYWLATLAGIGSAIVLGLVLSVPGLRVSRFYLAMVGFFLVALTPDIVQVFSGQTGGSAGLALPSPPTFFGRSMSTHGMFVLAAIALVVCLVLLQNVRASPFGVHVRRMRDDPFVLSVSGISPWNVRITTYLVTSLLGGIGGAVYSEINGYLAPYYFDITFTILLFAAVVIGGQTGLMGPALGVFLLYVIPRMVINVPGYSDLIYGCTILFGVIFLRDGVEEGIRDGWRAIRARASRREARRVEVSSGSDPAARERLPKLLWQIRSEHFAPQTLKVRGAKKAFGGNAALDLDTHTEVAVLPGQVHLLLGPNGSGKTTLLNATCGLVRLDGGTVTFGDRDVTRLSALKVARLGLARSYQSPRLPAELTPRELLAGMLAQLASTNAVHWILNDRSARRTRKSAAELAQEMLAVGGLGAAATTPNRSLTSGQRRILDVLVALSSQSSVVLLDEPAAGLSGDERRALAETVTSMAQLGVGFLVVEHDLELGFSLADQVTVLAAGRIVAQGPPSKVRDEKVAREVLMGAGR
jgi:branched-chain amino acid transport system permease protein